MRLDVSVCQRGLAVVHGLYCATYLQHIVLLKVLTTHKRDGDASDKKIHIVAME